MRAPLAALAIVALAACDPCECVNSCTRSYELRPVSEPPPLGTRVVLADRSESALDCEIDDVPKSLPEGPHTLKLTVRSVQPASGGTHSYTLDFLALASATDPPVSFCDGIDQTFASVTDLTATELEVGQRLCIVADLRTTTACTQKGCGS